MSYFLTTQDLQPKQIVEIAGDEARHILLARRMKKGERFELQGGDGKRFVVELVEAGKKSISVRTVQEAHVPEELPVHMVLYQAAVAEKALDMILQKSVELGAAEVMLFNCANVATQLAPAQFEKRQERWNKILWEAAKQSGRGKIPVLTFAKDMQEVMDSAKQLRAVYVCNANALRANFSVHNPQTLGIVVGPEGGLTDLETGKLQTLQNHIPLKLSHFTLRSETAAIAAMAVIQNIV